MENCENMEGIESILYGMMYYKLNIMLRLSEFRNELLLGSSSAMDMANRKSIIEQLKNGLTEPISLITIKDTTLDKALLLDGTKPKYTIV